jgi:hypothetical protein
VASPVRQEVWPVIEVPTAVTLVFVKGRGFDAGVPEGGIIVLVPIVTVVKVPAEGELNFTVLYAFVCDANVKLIASMAMNAKNNT